MRALWLALLTLREAVLKGTLLFFFIISNIIIVFFLLAIDVAADGGDTSITIFGNPVTPRGIPDFNPAEFLFLQLFGNSVFWAMLFGVFATAGLLPSMTEKGTIELYLSKPISRTSLLLARSGGAAAGVFLNLLYFAVAIWAVVGVKTGIWHGGFLLASLLTGIVFFFYYSVVALTGIITGSTGFSIMVALLFWFFTSALNQRELVLYPWWDNAVYHRLLDAAFYLSPQITRMVDSASRLIGTDLLKPSAEQIGFDLLPFLFSFLSAAGWYGAASWYFSRKDY